MNFSNRNKWITYKGIDMIYHDTSNSKTYEQEEILDDLYEKIMQSPREYLLVVNNVENTYMISSTVKKLRKYENVFRDKFKLFHIAIIGMNSDKRLIISSINKDSYFANDIEEAKDWLANKVN